MDFEEQFPRLAVVKCETFTRQCIMKMCLSKQRVKDIINNMETHETPYYIDKDELLKKLM